MNNSVIIKGNNHGITVVLDDKQDFEALKKQVAEKFTESSKFLGAAPVVLGFEGRVLLPDQERELLDVIRESCELQIICLVDNDVEREKRYEKTLNEKLMEMANVTGKFYKGTLRSGQALNFDTSVVILGDVNPGATVTSTGNIVVLGSLKGQANAGTSGNENAFVFATEMMPVMLKISDHLARCADKQDKEESHEMQIAFLEDGQICLEPISKKIWNDIRL